ncbi:MAG: Ldh family oxidoreductase [Proteobacteria bacterium]|nr:Ldh family oxidoreductase [Pseudomonadota bacterium]
MPAIQADRLREIGESILVAAGSPLDEAKLVAHYCVNANLAGHDSHGIMLILSYVDRIKRDHIVPGAPWEIIQESPSTTVVDGNWGFGYVVTERAMRLTIDKARQHNVAAATVYRQGHIGRLGTYPLMAAEAGMIGLITADSGRSAKAVIPFGGREKRLGTNPLCVAVPSNLDGPLCLDMSTAAVANGKISVALARNAEIPVGWVMDKDGKDTTDPNALAAGGGLLPLGGNEGYKGTGLAVIVEILCGVLTGLGFGVDLEGRHNDGCFLAVFNVEAFRPLAEFKREVTDFARYLNDTEPAEGSAGVLYPGEVEYRCEQERSRNGVPVEDSTWSKLRGLAKELGSDTTLFE